MDKYWSGVAKEIIKQYWDVDLHIPVYVNGRLSKTLGTYEFKIENKKVIPIRIQLAKELVQYGSEQFVRFILKHELCHFVLSQLGHPFKDGEEVFESELKRINAFSSKKIYVLYRIRCAVCCQIYNFYSKKSANKIMKEQACTCGEKSFVKHDVYYRKVDV